MANLAIITGGDIRYFGGGEKYVLELANRLDDCDITIFSRVEKTNIRLNNKDLNNITKTKIRFYNSPNIPILNTRIMLFSLSGLRVITELKKFDAVYSLDSTSINNVTLNFLSELYGFKYVFGIHDPSFFENRPQKTLVNRIAFKLYRLVNRKIFFGIKNIHVLTDYYKNKLETEGYKGNIYLIPNFLYYKKSSIKAAKNERRFIVLFGGRLAIYQKGIDLLVDIIKNVINKNKEIEFQIFGSGEDGQGLIETLSKQYRKNVKYLGFIPSIDMETRYKNSSLYIMTSRIEVFPTVVLEAQAHGLPVIAFNINGLNNIIADFSGSTIKPFDVDAFANEILKYYNLWKEGKLDIKYKNGIIEHMFAAYSDEVIIPKIKKMFTN